MRDLLRVAGVPNTALQAPPVLWRGGQTPLGVFAGGTALMLLAGTMAFLGLRGTEPRFDFTPSAGDTACAWDNDLRDADERRDHDIAWSDSTRGQTTPALALHADSLSVPIGLPIDSPEHAAETPRPALASQRAARVDACAGLPVAGARERSPP